MQKITMAASGLMMIVLVMLFKQAVSAERFYGLERMERFDQLPCFLEGTQVRQVSSRDRSGGNDDGFDGTYSALYVDERGEYVMFDEIGAGCLYRFWMTYSQRQEDAGYDTHRIRFYFDNEPTPRLDLSIDDFFDGVGSPLEFPMVGRWRQSSHGCYCYVPFPYRERLKITLSEKPYFYNMTYHRYDSSTGVVSWSGDEDRSTVMAQWNAVGDDPKPTASNLVVSGNLSIPAGTTGTLFNSSGAGTIQQIKLDPTPSTVDILSSVWLQMNWDGGEPEVNVPIGNFFGSGRNEINVTSLPIGMKSSGDWYCYFPMPHWQSAEIRLINTGDSHVIALPFELSYTTNVSEKAKTGYFHALFQSETFEASETDFNFIDEQGRGHVVGVSLFMESPGGGGYRDMNYLEGDERAYVDGALSPSIQGTGNEDYFNSGWYFNQGTFSRPYHGHPWQDQFNTDTPNYTQAYRFHLSDIIPFNQSIKFGVEHGHGNSSPGTYSSVTYYYKADDGSSAMVLTADIDLGDDWSEAVYDYQNPVETVEISNSWSYEGDDDDIVLVDEGYSYSESATFTIPLTENAGLLLRRRTDQGVGGQKAEVFVDDVYAGIWYEPDHTFTNVNHRWLDSEFMISSNLVAGKSSARIRIEPMPLSSLWNEYHYWAYCIKPLTSVEDSDGDSLPDAWELAHVTSLEILAADKDTDGDGFSDFSEYIAGTHPDDVESFFAIQSDVGIRVQSTIGRLYHVQRSTNLTVGGWHTIRSNVPGTGDSFVIPVDNIAPTAFHRLQVEKP